VITEREQESFLELVRPPWGYELTYCIGTTFTLELPCLIQMALNSRSSRDKYEELTTHEGYAIINDFASKAIVFTQNCRIKALDSEILNAGNCRKGRFFSLLDSIVAEVPIESIKSAFHPKVWLLRFDSIEANEPAIFKLFTMSRNLTSALNWDVSVSLIGETKTAGNHNASLISFIKTLATKSSIRKKENKLLQKAITDLKSVVFNEPKQSNIKSCEFQYKWPMITSFPPLEISKTRKAVIVSPFLSASELGKLKNIRDLYLITSTKDIEKIKNFPDLHDKTYILNIEQMDLHAKMYLIQNEFDSSMIIGSTNFTNSGWHGDNVEAHVLLKSAKNTVDNFITEFIFDENGRLNNWLKKYDPVDVGSDSDDQEKNEIKNILDEVQGTLAMGEFNLNYKNGKCELSFIGEKTTLPKGVTGHLSIVGTDAYKDLSVILNEGTIFSDIKVSDLCSFLIIKLRYRGGEKEFCIVAISNISRHQRNNSILKDSIRDWESFWDYVGVILEIESSSRFSSSNSGSNNSRNSKNKKRKNIRSVAMQSLEPILLSSINDSTVVEKIDTALNALRGNIGTDITDENYKSFLSFWHEFKLAHEEFRTHG